jgi:pimeloyl-ACP methyl ester carboxylesterase
MSPENVEEFALSKIGGPEYEAHMAKEGAKFATANAENIIELFGGLLSEVDKQALAGEASRKALADACRHGFANGYWGFFDDDRVFFSPWGFDVSDIKVPVAVWYGDEDLMVPPTHGAWLVEHIAGATVTHEPLEGHVSILSRYLDELAAQFEKAFE